MMSNHDGGTFFGGRLYQTNMFSRSELLCGAASSHILPL